VSGETHVLDDLNPDGTILDLKTRIQALLSVAPDLQRLIFAGRELQNPDLISSVGVSDDSTIHLVVRQAPPPPPESDSSPQNAFVAVPINPDQIVGAIFSSFFWFLMFVHRIWRW
jgi:hypothetical protein